MVRPISSRQLAVASLHRGLRGYRLREVRGLLRRAQRAVERVERGEFSRLSAAEVEAVQFGMRPFGWRYEEVDDLLDRVAETLRPLGSFAPVRPDPPGFLLTSTKLRRTRFKKRRRGYDREQVEHWVEAVAAELDRLEAGLPPTRPTAEELDLVAFDQQLGGYDEVQVDRFLDQAAATLSRRRTNFRRVSGEARGPGHR